MLDSRQLRYFVTVAEDLHFGRAADRLHLAQSALSTQIRRLEEHLGVRLFSRNKRASVRLTAAGELFLGEARAALRQLERAENLGRAAARGEAGHVALGYVGSAVTCGFLAEVLAAFRARYPEVRLQVLAMETPRQLEALNEGIIDVGLIRPRPHYPEGIKAKIAHREPLAIALPQDHPLASRERLRAADLKEEAFIAPQFNEAAGVIEWLGRLGARGGFQVEPAHRVNDFITAASMAAAGYGVVLLPRSMKAFAQKGVVFRPVEDLDDEIELAIAYRHPFGSPSVQAFVEVARGLIAPG